MKWILTLLIFSVSCGRPGETIPETKHPIYTFNIVKSMVWSESAESFVLNYALTPSRGNLQLAVWKDSEHVYLLRQGYQYVEDSYGEEYDLIPDCKLYTVNPILYTDHTVFELDYYNATVESDCPFEDSDKPTKVEISITDTEVTHTFWYGDYTYYIYKFRSI